MVAPPLPPPLPLPLPLPRAIPWSIPSPATACRRPSNGPTFRFNADTTYPARLNAAEALVDHHVAAGQGARVAIRHERDGRIETVTYAELAALVSRIAHVLVERHGAGARQPRAAARAEQPDDGGLLAGHAQGRADRRADHAAAARRS